MIPKNEAPYHLLGGIWVTLRSDSLCFFPEIDSFVLLTGGIRSWNIVGEGTAALSLLERFEQLSSCHVR